MIKRLLLAIIVGSAAVLAALQLQLVAIPWNMQRDAFGCADPKIYTGVSQSLDDERIRLSDKNATAMFDVLAPALLASSAGQLHCDVLKENERIFITKIELSALVRLRRPNSSDEYWTALSAILPWSWKV
jgi:hypothetical protein